MQDKLHSLYFDTMHAAFTTFLLNPSRYRGRNPMEVLIPVIPGVFPGESVKLAYDERSSAVTISVPMNGVPFEKTAGPFIMLEGPISEIPVEMQQILEEFASSGPARLISRFRGLIQEFLRIGISIDEIHTQIDIASAESIMDD